MIGIDLVEVKRLNSDQKFLERIADEEEILYIKNTLSEKVMQQRIASLWAVKEAVMKALELGKGSLVSFKDIKLRHAVSGKPEVELFGVAKQEMDINHYGKEIEVSISHTEQYATAVAIIK